MHILCISPMNMYPLYISPIHIHILPSRKSPLPACWIGIGTATISNYEFLWYALLRSFYVLCKSMDSELVAKVEADGKTPLHPHQPPSEGKKANQAARRCVLAEGTKVQHNMHGFGVVIEVDMDNERGRPYSVVFDNGESAPHDLVLGTRWFLYVFAC